MSENFTAMIASAPRILIVDDNAAIHQDFRKLLEPCVNREVEQAELELFGATSAPAGEQVAAVGRNEPCPCGSGKKYKQCHGKLV